MTAIDATCSTIAVIGHSSFEKRANTLLAVTACGKLRGKPLGIKIGIGPGPSISGALIELDPSGKTICHADVFTRIEQAAKHFASVGLGREHVRKFLR